jgi:sulfur-oxidizing protein SoxA
VIARILFVLAAFGASASAQDIARPQPLRWGIEFQSADVRGLQADDFANPGMLWVARGASLWGATLGARASPPCESCHGDAARSMKGVATAYPKFDAGLRRVVNLEERIEACHRMNQGGTGLAPESDTRLSLAAFVAHQSRGMPLAVSLDGPARAVLERGAALYGQRVGQMNLACHHCHDLSWGKTLLAETVSQGHPEGWPAYRLEWQSLGSLQRRLRACFFGVRAEQPPFGSPDLVALELYLAARARGLPISVPGVRR